MKRRKIDSGDEGEDEDDSGPPSLISDDEPLDGDQLFDGEDIDNALGHLPKPKLDNLELAQQMVTQVASARECGVDYMHVVLAGASKLGHPLETKMSNLVTNVDSDDSEDDGAAPSRFSQQPAPPRARMIKRAAAHGLILSTFIGMLNFGLPPALFNMLWATGSNFCA